MEAILWITDILLIQDLIERISKRRKARQEIREWLERLSRIQKQLLATCVLAASRSNLRVFELPAESVGPFEAQCTLLLDTGAVSVSKYAPPGIRRYRFKPWLYDYLAGRPELLVMKDPPSKKMVVREKVMASTARGRLFLASIDPLAELKEEYQNYWRAIDMLGKAVEGGSNDILYDAIDASLLAVSRLYAAHGSPFGPTDDAKLLWNKYWVSTTVN